MSTDPNLELDVEIAAGDAFDNAYRAWQVTVIDRNSDWIWTVVDAFDEYAAREENALMDAIDQLRHEPHYYRAYLETPLWKARAARAKHWGICGRCGAWSSSLDAHHRTYERLGRERPSDLIALCRGCHQREHGR